MWIDYFSTTNLEFAMPNYNDQKRNTPLKLRWVSVLMTTALLATACGGGGGGDPASVPAGSSPAAGEAAPATTPSTTTDTLVVPTSASVATFADIEACPLSAMQSTVDWPKTCLVNKRLVGITAESEYTATKVPCGLYLGIDGVFEATRNGVLVFKTKPYSQWKNTVPGSGVKDVSGAYQNVKDLNGYWVFSAGLVGNSGFSATKGVLQDSINITITRRNSDGYLQDRFAQLIARKSAYDVNSNVDPASTCLVTLD
jgi:hypothetical protein